MTALLLLALALVADAFAVAIVRGVAGRAGGVRWNAAWAWPSGWPRGRCR